MVKYVKIKSLAMYAYRNIFYKNKYINIKFNK